MNIDSPGQFADYIAYHLDFKFEDKQAILEMASLSERVRKVLVLMDTALELAETQKRLQREVKEEIDRNQREYVLREQIKALQRELSGNEDFDDEIEMFREKLEQLKLSEVVNERS